MKQKAKMENPTEIYRRYFENSATRFTREIAHPKNPSITIQEIDYLIVPYIDYRSDGLNVEGEEDFSYERWKKQHGEWWIYTPMGKLDKGGHRRWDCHGTLCARSAREARKIAEILYPGQEIKLRKW